VRILQIVTLISADGAYGGPARVAANQADALRALGHTVMVAGGWRGKGAPPLRRTPNDPHLFKVWPVVPRAGFAGLTAPKLLAWVNNQLVSIDVVHLHLARDLVTLPVAGVVLAHGIPLVVQTHGMIDRSNRLLAKPLDVLITRRVLRNAAALLYLTDGEAVDLASVAGEKLRLEHVTNGVPGALIVRAAEVDAKPEVLFLARLHPRKRPDVFVRMAKILLAQGVSARFAMVGPDEGALPSVTGQGVPDVPWEGSISPEEVIGRLSRASVYVLPSVEEPYPMSVLEAMSVGVPVVITESNGLAPLVRRTGAGLVTDTSAEALAVAVATLIADPALRTSAGAAAIEVARNEMQMSTVADRLVAIYTSAMARVAGRSQREHCEC
jgi:glycosyltransferase involved in cell wall biosynthesis